MPSTLFDNHPLISRLTPNQRETLKHARGLKQFTDQIKGFEQGKCLFCDPLGPKNVVVFQNEVHRMWVNPFPLNHTSLHLIMAPIKHVLGTDPVVFTAKYRNSVNELIEWAYNKYPVIGQTGGGMVKRFGPCQHNVGTIEHDHDNLIVTDLTGEVRITLAKEPHEIETATRRAEIYLTLLSGKSRLDLTQEEQELVKGRLD